MELAIARWVAPIVVVKLTNAEFYGSNSDQLIGKLSRRFPGAHVAIITMDASSETGLRSHESTYPHVVLSSELGVAKNDTVGPIRLTLLARQNDGPYRLS